MSNEQIDFESFLASGNASLALKKLAPAKNDRAQFATARAGNKRL